MTLLVPVHRNRGILTSLLFLPLEDKLKVISSRRRVILYLCNYMKYWQRYIQNGGLAKRFWCQNSVGF